MSPPIASWPAWAQEAYAERAAIMHFDGGLDLAEAKRKAEAAIILEMAVRAAAPRPVARPTAPG